MYNRVTMLGRVVNDLAVKQTPQGVAVLSFSIAVDRRYQTKGEEKKADFFNCVARRNEAEFIARYWTKGKPILIEGELQNRSYTDKNGVNRQVTEIIVDRACFTGDAKASSSGSTAAEAVKSAVSAVVEAEEPPREYTAADFVNYSTDEDYLF